ncbi:DEAD/DEAH box helicase [Acinetobacter baumannii]|nr:DEAD/DEAH box helicase [Acinetobacter baumannii]
MSFMRERQMKPEFNSNRLLGVTRSKEKMYEFQIPIQDHINPYKDGNPDDLFYLTIGILGDSAALLNDGEKLTDEILNNLLFSAKFFDSYIGARFNKEFNTELKLLASAAYYLINRPGSSLVMANKISSINSLDELKIMLWKILSNNYSDKITITPYTKKGHFLNEILQDINNFLNRGYKSSQLQINLNDLRNYIYINGSSEELLLTDLIIAVTNGKINNSPWNRLPVLSNLSVDLWSPIIRKDDFPKELWPSQIKIGEAGFFKNASGLIQMPTSAGKTKSIEMILHSAFLAKRTKLAIVVAPFRALCNEITHSLKNAFKNTDIKINEISDALQLDFIESISELLGTDYSSLNYILILTPEKLLYVLRQLPSLINHLGLLIYDEGHQFDSGKRGITYELLLSEIKSLLPESTQTILISAVIQNAQDISNWLIGTNSQIVDGTKLLASSKSIAFASWLEGKGGKLHFKEDFPYFVPRIFSEKELERFDRDRVDRVFPEHNNTDISLDLAIRLLPQGPVAIYSGLKSSAMKIIKRAVDIYTRKIDVLPPVYFSVTEEVDRIYSLICKHFGEDSELAKGAKYGFFLHHGTTPNGLRLCIEYAMQKHLIKFISCTSTLAQGVNLPIRYLIVTSMNQAGEQIKVRDFQNLIGRAGRSSMHTEGLIIFADPEIYDSKDRYKYNSALSLLDLENTEAVSSSLLEIIQPIVTSKKYQGKYWQISMPIELLTSDEKTCIDWIEEAHRKYGHLYTDDDLKNAIFGRKKLVNTIESYLMANRLDNPDEDFIAESENLAKKTLAYSLASATERLDLIKLFREVAVFITNSISDPLVQKEYSKTLLGVRETEIIHAWVDNNKNELNSTENKFRFLELIWPLILSLSDSKFLHNVTPSHLALEIVKLWIEGVSYKIIFEYVTSQNGRVPHGQGSRKISEDLILNFLEQTLSFDVGLFLSAMATFLCPEGMGDDHYIFEFQKLIKYGLPDSDCTLVYELGFSDRVIAQEVVNLVRNDDLNFPVEFVFKQNAFKTYKKIFKRYFQDYPAYFQNVINTL